MDEKTVRPVTIHNLKLKEQYVRPLLEGKLRYQVRFDDRGYQAGDIIKFKVVGIEGKQLKPADYSYCAFDEILLIEGRYFKVDYVMAHEGLKSGYVAFSIAECPKPAGA